ncbi:hypothetical protein HHK36_012402 [Tetracentron sinense]|uniref:J domain-containing protein n=1 Tax=Tetracentron sinense TaxID=13715 RepID=A0A835DEJ4_TETSI|nr:hypothetical protein HHK36_012402 [Tetracentron sinense]
MRYFGSEKHEQLLADGRRMRSEMGRNSGGDSHQKWCRRRRRPEENSEAKPAANHGEQREKKIGYLRREDVYRTEVGERLEVKKLAGEDDFAGEDDRKKGISLNAGGGQVAGDIKLVGRVVRFRDDDGEMDEVELLRTVYIGYSNGLFWLEDSWAWALRTDLRLRGVPSKTPSLLCDSLDLDSRVLFPKPSEMARDWIMDGNKDEASRCIGIAEAAIALGNKQRALKFIRIAQRLNHNLSVDDLLAACEKVESVASTSPIEEKPVVKNQKEPAPSKSAECSNEERNYTEEHVKLIREVKKNNDYYAILGVEKSCLVEEIRRAYRKLSLKVHPDKNKAPGSEEAFKKVCKAFKCLSDEDSRRQYDQTGLVDEFEYNQQHNVRRRRRRTTTHDLFDDDFDPDEIFRSFFGQGDMFRAAHVYRARGMASQHGGNVNGGGPNLMVLLQILPILVIFLLAYLPFSEPDYSLHKTHSYQIPKVTEKYGIEFYVRTPDFDQHFPLGSPSRANIEDHVIREHKSMLGRYCHIELQRRQWNRNYPTPYCDKLQNLSVA